MKFLIVAFLITSVIVFPLLGVAAAVAGFSKLATILVVLT